MAEYQGCVLPSSPTDQLRLSQMINEVVNSMTRSKSEAEHKKDTIQAIHEEFAIPKELISSAAKIMFKQNMNEVKAKQDDLADLVDVIVNARTRSRVQAVAKADAVVDTDDSEE